MIECNRVNGFYIMVFYINIFPDIDLIILQQ